MVQTDDFFAGHREARAVFDKVQDVLGRLGPFEIRVTKSQVAFCRRRGFAYVWIPGRYLHGLTAEVVLSIALPRHDGSPRFKEVVHPAARIWMHHLEVALPHEIDQEVRDWLREAADAAGGHRTGRSGRS